MYVAEHVVECCTVINDHIRVTNVVQTRKPGSHSGAPLLMGPKVQSLDFCDMKQVHCERLDLLIWIQGRSEPGKGSV